MPKLRDTFARVDRTAGDILEKAVRDHHYRRLNRLGWHRILDLKKEGLPAVGDPPVRGGNDVRILIDGASVFPEMEQAIREARSHVHLASWYVSTDFRMVRANGQTSADETESGAGTLRGLLADVAKEIPVRVLLWAGPPMSGSPMGRPEIRSLRKELIEGTKIQCLLDSRERPLHTHHEKIVIIDDEVAFVGGLDPTYAKGDRYDSNSHPFREGLGWHDTAAQLRGPAVGDVAAHFNLRWHAISGQRPPAVRPQSQKGSIDVQVLATIPERIYPSVPRGVFRIFEAYLRALNSAKELVYIENQFLWSPEIVAVLRDKLLSPPSDGFRLLIVLPSSAITGTDATRGQLSVLLEADHHNRMLACAAYARAGEKTNPIYVHSKLAIVDDCWLTLGSANLNDHSLLNDTELNVAVLDPKLARETRLRLWAEHLELPMAQISRDPATVIEEMWRQIADEQYVRREKGQPMTHRVARLPGISRRSDRLLGPLQGLLLDG